jgi:hypothetical protein
MVVSYGTCSSIGHAVGVGIESQLEHQGFCGFPQALPANARKTPLLHPYVSFPICHA